MPVPQELQEQIRLVPFQMVYLAREGDKLLVTTMSRQEIGERIVHLLKEGLSGVAWEDIERGRNDDAQKQRIITLGGA